MNIHPSLLRFCEFTSICCRHCVGSITYRRLAALQELIQCYLCLTWILTCVSPISPNPCILCYQVFGSVLIRLPHCCLHSSPSCSSPSETPLPTMFRMQLQVLKQRTGFFAVCSHQPLQLCWLCGGPFSPLPGEGNGYPLQYSCLENPMDKGAWQATVHGHRVRHDSAIDTFIFTFFLPLSVCIFWSLCPQARDQCVRAKKKGEKWALPFPLLLQWVPVPPVFPQPTEGCT